MEKFLTICWCQEATPPSPASLVCILTTKMIEVKFVSKYSQAQVKAVYEVYLH